MNYLFLIRKSLDRESVVIIPPLEYVVFIVIILLEIFLKPTIWNFLSEVEFLLGQRLLCIYILGSYIFLLNVVRFTILED